MTLYLNTKRQYENYKELSQEKYFVDKSEIISIINENISTKSKYICVTRPRRFGKSSVADMLGAYYSKAVDSKAIFDKLKISKNDDYLEKLNKYNVISISFAEIDSNCSNCVEYIDRISNLLREDLKEKFPNANIDEKYTIWEVFSQLDEKFIFIFDEWDYIFNANIFEEDQDKFLEFLMKLLKDKPYVALAYMTGILPIKKYSSGSSLNMFDEFTILNDMIYGEYFGFTEEEVKVLCDKQSSISFDEISSWYNGYLSEEGSRIYNPRSVIKALKNKKCKSYWTNTGAMDEVEEYLKYNILEIRDEVIEMVSGEEIDIFIDEEFRAGQGTPKTKEEIYSAMIVLGFLSYHDGYLKIPNKELMKEFEKALSDESFGYVSKIIENSRKMLKATVDGNTEVVEDILHDIHNSEIPILQYNDENSLSCVLTLAYLSARDTYRIEREEKTGKGYADFTFHPRRKNDIAFIVELKKDEETDVALNQIKEKEYVEKFRKEHKDRKVLAVAICYNSKNKEHHCKIEEIN